MLFANSLLDSLTLQTHQPVKRQPFRPNLPNFGPVRPIGVGRGQNGIPWQEITSSVVIFGWCVVFCMKKCGDSNSNWADFGNNVKQKKPWKIIYVVSFGFGPDCLRYGDRNMWVSFMKCFSQPLPDSDTYDSTLYIKKTVVNQKKKNNQQKKAPTNSGVSPRKQRFHQEF